MKLLILIMGLFVGVISAGMSIFEDWNAYKIKYHKSYLGYDDFTHRLTYISNKNRILAYNRLNRKYKLGIGEFADLNTFQYNQMLGGLRLSPPTPMYPTTTSIPPRQYPLPPFAPPIYRNWTKDGGVTEVKNQGTHCNAAWAFAALAALEGHYFFANMKLPPSLSVQNVIDCSGAQTPCSGEQEPSTAYDYIINNENVNSELRYPYTGYPGSCKYDQNNVGATLGAYEKIKENDDGHLFEIVAFQGPVVVGFDPFSFEFQHYSNGIFVPPRTLYGTTNRFAMVVVGYGHDNELNLDYWILKNSMGINWGENGYIRVIRDSFNHIAKSASFPNV